MEKMREKMAKKFPGEGKREIIQRQLRNIALEGTLMDMGQTSTTSKTTSGKGRYVSVRTAEHMRSLSKYSK